MAHWPRWHGVEGLHYGGHSFIVYMRLFVRNAVTIRGTDGNRRRNRFQNGLVPFIVSHTKIQPEIVSVGNGASTHLHENPITNITESFENSFWIGGICSISRSIDLTGAHTHIFGHAARLHRPTEYSVTRTHNHIHLISNSFYKYHNSISFKGPTTAIYLAVPSKAHYISIDGRPSHIYATCYAICN